MGAGTSGTSVVVGGSNPAVMTKDDVENLVRQQVANGGFDTSNPQSISNIMLPPGTDLQDGNNTSMSDPNDPTKGGLGGFHGSGNINGKEVHYAVNAYSQDMGDGRVNGINFTSKPTDNVSITRGTKSPKRSPTRT